MPATTDEDQRQAAVAAVSAYLAAPSWAHSPYLSVQATEIVDLACRTRGSA